MTYRIFAKTTFDITATGVRNYYKSSRMPFHDSRGEMIDSMESWTRARTQQRNWETVNQIISLRTLPSDITEPIKTVDQQKVYWQFDFEIDSIESVTLADNPVGYLERDSQDVPMILGLDETQRNTQFLKPDGDDANIWFWIKSN